MHKGWEIYANKKRRQKSRNGKKEGEKEEWQKRWREAGPIRFAEELLTCPLDVPKHPDFDSNNNPDIRCMAGKDCPIGEEHPKFRDNGIPYHIILSEDQKLFLRDLWKNGVDMALLAAARGAGKTFSLGVWNCWRIATHDNYSITCMGGSSKQSEYIQDYIDGWRLDIPIVMKIIYKSLHGIKKSCFTIGRSKCDFPACSTLSARGAHVNEVDIDECCAAEDKSEDGAKAVAAVQWQTTGKRKGKIILTSTVQYIHGKFYEYMKDPKTYGFKVYRWGIAKHVSGNKDPYATYKDKNPENWIPNVWWITNDELGKKRISKSDEEWLCEALGGASLASGAVFKKEDLDIVICDKCPDCEPYVWGKCKLCPFIGISGDPTKFVIERRAGFDYGISNAPCALTVVGRRNNVVFVLHNDEQMGLREEEKVDWIKREMVKWKTSTFIPDPAVAGKHLNEKLDDEGYAVYMLAEQDKLPRVFNIINFVEKHKIIIPKAFWFMTQSLRKLAWKKTGLKLRKVDDHSFDSLQYAIEDWQVEEGGNILDEFLKSVAKKGKDKITVPTIDDIYGKDKKGTSSGRSGTGVPRIEDIFD